MADSATPNPEVFVDQAAIDKSEKTKKMIKIGVIAVIVIVLAWFVWKKVLKK